jgi:hypothetical protein
VQRKAARAMTASGRSVTKERPRHHGADRRREAVEDLVELAGQIGLHVEGREAQHEQEPGEHETEPGEEAAQLAAAEPSQVDAELVGLRPRQHLVHGERPLEGLLRHPALGVHALVLDHRDLRRRAAPGEAAELQEAQEDRAWRVAHWRRCILAH